MKAKGKGKKLSSMRIEPASNGYTVHSHHEPTSGDDDGPQMPMSEKPAVFGSKEDVIKHVSDQLDAHESASGGGSSDKSDHPLRKGLFGKSIRD